MSQQKLVKLESVRGFAAIYVVLHHLNQLYPFKFHYLNYLFRFGQEAVILFFLMSGFVIYFSTFSKKNQDQLTFKEYFLKRFIRIYPLFIIALALTYLASCIYTGKTLPVQIGTLLGNIFNLQDFSTGKPGVWITPYYGNLPLWSLSYEWWFYMIFWLIIKLPGEKQYFTIVLIATLGSVTYYLSPNSASLIFTYLIIWWTGVELAKIYIARRNYTFKDFGYLFKGLIFITILLSFQAFQAFQDFDQFTPGLHPFLEIRHFLAALVFVLSAILWSQFGFVAFDYILGLFSRIAPISYGIYIFHYPLISGIPFIALYIPLHFRIILALFIVVLFSYVMEIKLQKFFNELGKKMLLNRHYPKQI